MSEHLTGVLGVCDVAFANRHSAQEMRFHVVSKTKGVAEEVGVVI